MRRKLTFPIRPTVRLRLTLLYGGLFIAAGVLLVAITYGLLRNELAPPPRESPPNGQNGSPNKVGGGPGDSFGDNGQTRDQVISDVRREERSRALSQMLTQSGIAIVLASLGALALGWVVAGRVLSPVQQITAHAQRASQATLDERISLRGPPDELKELADTIDAMLDRLQAAFDAQRHFAAKASHELRTPLAIIHAEADVAIDAPDATERERRLGEAIRSAAERSERLVDGLLALARSESTLVDESQFDLAELAGDVVGDYARIADTATVALDLSLETAMVSGDRTLVERMVGNLVENAIRYNHSGGWVHIAVGTDSSEAVLRVTNSGPVVDANAVDALFEPFRRGEIDRRERQTGFGLGLAIVRSVAAVHGGSLKAEARPEGGLNVVVRLPVVGPLTLVQPDSRRTRPGRLKLGRGHGERPALPSPAAEL
jgi:signal transduction histidine kinase